MIENEQTRFHYGIVPLVIAPLAGFLLTSFSDRVRKLIKQRDRSCQWPLEGDDDMHVGYLEAAHYDHSRSNPRYDTPENGQLLCTKHHQAQHIANAGHNGLTESQNNWAVDAIGKRLKLFKEP